MLCRSVARGGVSLSLSLSLILTRSNKFVIQSSWRHDQVRTANLLGVAGTDIPVTELKKRTPAYKVCSVVCYNNHFLPNGFCRIFLFKKYLKNQLGVNGYSFIVNNNGYVLYHPDHRPLVRKWLSNHQIKLD